MIIDLIKCKDEVSTGVYVFIVDQVVYHVFGSFKSPFFILVDRFFEFLSDVPAVLNQRVLEPLGHENIAAEDAA